MKICIVGTGAVGGYFGSLLFRSESMLLLWEQSQRENKRWLIVMSELSVKITDDFGKIADSDLILAVKSYTCQVV
jgi:ketopantoate reductase